MERQETHGKGNRRRKWEWEQIVPQFWDICSQPYEGGLRQFLDYLKKHTKQTGYTDLELNWPCQRTVTAKNTKCPEICILGQMAGTSGLAHHEMQ